MCKLSKDKPASPSSDSDIIKAIARIQHEREWDFKDTTIADLVALSDKLAAEFPAGSDGAFQYKA